MVSIGDFIFGTESSAEFQTKPTKTKTQTKAIDDLVRSLFTEFEGFDTTPQPTGRQQALQTNIDQLIGSYGGASGTLSSLLNIDQGALDEEFNAAVRDPLIRDFEEQILPMVTRRYGGASFGSERKEAEARTYEDLLQTLSSERAQFQSQNRQRQLQALGLIPGLSSGFGAAAEFADIEELRRQQAYQERLQLIQSLLGATGQNVFENLAVAKPGQAGALQGFLTGFGEGVGSSL